MSSAAALRQQRHRRREREGKIPLMVEVDEAKIVEVLVAAKLIDPMADHAKAEIEAAVERLLGDRRVVTARDPPS
jgi:hypothetical protein